MSITTTSAPSENSVAEIDEHANAHDNATKSESASDNNDGNTTQLALISGCTINGGGKINISNPVLANKVTFKGHHFPAFVAHAGPGRGCLIVKDNVEVEGDFCCDVKATPTSGAVSITLH
jgi:hypothetical protein